MLLLRHSRDPLQRRGAVSGDAGPLTQHPTSCYSGRCARTVAEFNTVEGGGDVVDTLGRRSGC